jgi:hypothetical protein
MESNYQTIGVLERTAKITAKQEEENSQNERRRTPQQSWRGMRSAAA